MAIGDADLIFQGFSGGTTQVLQLELRFQATGYEVRRFRSTMAKAGFQQVGSRSSDAPHALELDWRVASAAGANNGGLTFWHRRDFRKPT